MEQYNIFDYLEQQDIDYVKYLANYLKEWVKEWNYDYLIKLKEKNTIEVFLRNFCKFTKTHFFNLTGILYDDDADLYGARVDKKDNTVSIYKCGNDKDKILATEPIERLVEELVK